MGVAVWSWCSRAMVRHRKSALEAAWKKKATSILMGWMPPPAGINCATLVMLHDQP